MTLAPWRSPLAAALHRNRSLVHARYVQLATIQSNGRPANRTVVFRGFCGNTNQLQFVTDSRSQKVEQIERSPWGEVCWYFPKTREQFRIAGQLILVSEHHADALLQSTRKKMWQELSDAARSQFTWPESGKPRALRETFELPSPNATTPLPQFSLLLMQPDWVDHLELQGNPQNRWLYHHSDTGWFKQEVNP